MMNVLSPFQIMDLAYLKKNYEDVFKPFFTLDPSRNKMKGESGLGMTISRDIIRSHGGDIKLSQSSIGGLKTVINLPL